MKRQDENEMQKKGEEEKKKGKLKKRKFKRVPGGSDPSLPRYMGLGLSTASRSFCLVSDFFFFSLFLLLLLFVLANRR